MDATKKYGNERWFPYSPKLGRTVYLFSNLEYEHWLQVEFNPNVVDFCEQPLKVKSKYKDTNGASIFDMWVQYKDGSEEFIEIKYKSDLLKDRVKKQIDVQKNWCRENNKIHKVMTELEIQQGSVKLSNIKLMIKYLDHDLNQPEQLKIIKQQLLGNRLTIENLSNASKIPYQDTFLIVTHLIYMNEVNSNYTEKPFGKKTEVWI
ncbi:TnsA endonuclease N-terminal domain-containing protein [Lysinibacillus xylanilyticus]|uniref:TnsA endonuclease N-terminal domain-containing protein n=1 Tax=Lysinibacillus xylanilyticus TaxID=582475 RepID=UPI003827E928